MTSREIIVRVLRRDHPPRIGLALPEPYTNDVDSSNIPAKPGHQPPALAPHPGEDRRWKDEYGNIWVSLRSFIGGEIVEGAIRDWSQLDDYQLPDLANPIRYAQVMERWAKTDKFRIGSLGGFVFIHSRNLRKLENYLEDLICERENVMRLHARILEMLLSCVDRWADIGADAVMVWEDWGTQDRLMVSPAMWREIYKPYFVELCRRAHARGMFVFMHSCGKMTEIIPDLIEAGIDCFEFDQPRIHGIDTLAGWHDRVSFWSPVDIQRTLYTRDPKKIRDDAREMVQKLGRGGGFIAFYYSGNEAIGITPEVQDHACRAFMEFARDV